MISVREHVPLAPLTTFKVGGAARYVIDCADSADLREARAFARARALPLLALGGGSNILVPDAGVEAVAVRLTANDIREEKEGGRIMLSAGAGAAWDDVVRYAALHGWWGIENLAGIPGSTGAAPVQNIGAYGAELADTIYHIKVFNCETGEESIASKDEARFSYRHSIFKERRELIVLSVSLSLSARGKPKIGYRDLAEASQKGVALTTPEEIGAAVRTIRSGKFPDLSKEGTAGSFFKNPVITRELADSLAARYPGLPQFPQADGSVKVPLAYILDQGLGLKGFSLGAARLFEAQPLVIVAAQHARASDIEALSAEVERRVEEATGIRIEREVETFGARA